MRQYLTSILFLTFLACNTRTNNEKTARQQVPFQESGLKIACSRAIKTLDNEVHGIHFLDNNGKLIEIDSINKLLYSIAQFDNFTQSNSTKFITKKNEQFEKTNLKETAYKLIVTSLLMENPGNLPIDNPRQTQIALQDFDLYLNDNKKQISIRVLNEYDVIKIRIGTTEIRQLSESIPIGLEKVISTLDSLKERNASR